MALSVRKASSQDGSAMPLWCSGSVFMLVCRGGSWCWPAPLVPERYISMNASSQGHSQDEQIISPTVCSRHSSDCCFNAVSRMFACILSRNRAACSGLYPSQACCPLKRQALRPTGCKNSQNSAPLIFQTNGVGATFSLCIPLGASLFLFLLYNHI